MLEPVLPEYCDAFKRLRRLQRWTVIITPLLVAVLLPVAIGLMNLLSASDRVFDIVMMCLGMGMLGIAAVLMGYWEIKKNLIFHRDLRARDTAHAASESRGGPRAVV